jgi:pyruvate formate lyase activating enzyme
MNPDIYRRYTSQENTRLQENLLWLADNIDLQKVTIRLPHIPDYNTQKDISQSRKQLEAMGFKDFDCFDYITPNGAC